MPLLKNFERKGKILLLKVVCLFLPEGKHFDNIRDKKGEIKKILITRLENRMGNVVMNTFYPKALKEQFPEAEVDFFLYTSLSSLLDNNPHVDNVFTYDPDVHLKNPLNILKILRKLRKKKYHIVFDCSTPGTFSVSSAILTRIINGKYRIGFKRGESDRFLNISVTADHSQHYITMLHALLETVFELKNEYKPEIYISTDENNLIQNKLEKIDPAGQQKLVVISVRAKLGHGIKLSLEDIRKIGSGLVENPEIKIVYLCSIFEKEEYDILNSEEPDNVLYLNEKREICALFSQCDLFLSGDGGLTHLAYASGTKMVTIFSQKNYTNYGYDNGIDQKIIMVDAKIDDTKEIGSIKQADIEKTVNVCTEILGNNPVVSENNRVKNQSV